MPHKIDGDSDIRPTTRPCVAPVSSHQQTPDHVVTDEVVTSLAYARLHRQVDRLPDLERRVVRWSFGLGIRPGAAQEALTVAQIADRLNMTRPQVRDIRERALDRLRQTYGVQQAA